MFHSCVHGRVRLFLILRSGRIFGCKILYKQLIDFLNENNVIAKNQSGFCAQHSTETTLLHSTNTCSWLVNVDKGLINGILSLDLIKGLCQLSYNRQDCAS